MSLANQGLFHIINNCHQYYIKHGSLSWIFHMNQKSIRKGLNQLATSPPLMWDLCHRPAMAWSRWDTGLTNSRGVKPPPRIAYLSVVNKLTLTGLSQSCTTYASRPDLHQNRAETYSAELSQNIQGADFFLLLKLS